MSDEEKSLEDTRDKKQETKTEEVKEEKVEETKSVPSDEVTSNKEEKVEEKAEEKKSANRGSAISGEEKSAESASKSAKSTSSSKFNDLIEKIEKLSALDLAELVKALEEKFGVSASAPMMAMGAMPAAGGAPVEAEEEKASYTVHLADSGAQKIAVIKVIRVIRPDLGLKEAKDLVDGAPKDIKTDVPKVDAEEAKKKLEAAGAKCELK